MQEGSSQEKRRNRRAAARESQKVNVGGRWFGVSGCRLPLGVQSEQPRGGKGFGGLSREGWSEDGRFGRIGGWIGCWCGC